MNWNYESLIVSDRANNRIIKFSTSDFTDTGTIIAGSSSNTAGNCINNLILIFEKLLKKKKSIR